MTSVVQLVHRMLGGLESTLELNEFEFDDDEITSSQDASEEAKSTKSPTKGGQKSAFEKQKSYLQSKAQKEPVKKNSCFLYPKTCGFAWNQYG